MKKLLKNRNVLLGLAAVLLMIAVWGISQLVDTTPDTLPDLPVDAQETPVPGETQAPAAQEMPRGYVYIQANGEGKWIALPTAEEDLYITISREDDSGVSNTLRLMKNGFVMHSSTCDNQDCVMQGEVTLENKEERVLMHMVICLPHNVSAELYSMEELMEMLAQSAREAQ